MARIVILGGGFGGVPCAATLYRRLPREAHEIVLYNRENHMIFSPLLAEAVGSSLSPLDVVAPLRHLLPGVHCRTEEVTRIDSASHEVEYEGHDGRLDRSRYDHLVIACGNIASLSAVPGMADHAFPLKTIGDAVILRSHVLEQMEKAEVCDEPAKKRWYLSFIIVGGGYSGVETAGEINDLVRGSIRFFQTIRPDDVAVTLIHSREQILPEIGPTLREFSRHKMEQAGVRVRLNARVALATPDGVGLENGEFLSGATIVSTIGTTMAPVLERFLAQQEKGRLLTEPDMRVPGCPNVWAIGDCALITNTYDGRPAPPTGQFAEREGRQVAENIVRVLQGRPTKPFYFKPLGQLCSIGGHVAVAELFGARLSGFLAWVVWRGVYLLKHPSWAHRFKIGFDWAWLLLFPRDLSHLRASGTDRVSHAHYKPGDYVFHQGDPPANFYVIEQGEAEIVRQAADERTERVEALLGHGAFFGEQALLDNSPRQSGVRARTLLEVLVLGRNVFTNISKSLTPLRHAFAQALSRRKMDVWQARPDIYATLHRTPLSALVEPVPLPLLQPTATLREATVAMLEHNHDFLYISSESATLEGLVTMTDAMRAVSAGAKPETPVSEFMTRDPVTISLADTSLTAVGTMREHQFKSLPVVEDARIRRLAGCLRIRTMMVHVLKQLKEGDAAEIGPLPGSPRRSMSDAD